MKLVVLLIVAATMTGCGRMWVEMYTPTTDSEREMTIALVSHILKGTPSSLAGFDQDWDDAIVAAEMAAKRIVCRPTLWEYKYDFRSSMNYTPTGRWRYADETNQVSASLLPAMRATGVVVQVP